MKVAYFIGGLSRGGAETLVLDVCRRHETVPYDFVCIYRHEGNISEEFKQSGAPLIKVAKKRGVLRYIFAIREIILREEVTIVHSQTPSNTLLLAVALLGTGVKIVTTFHGHSFADAVWWKRKIVYGASEKILCVSEYQKRYYEEKWGLAKENKLKVVYNGIDFTKLDCVNEGVRELESEGIKLAMVGNFIKGRSQMVVAQALARLDARHLDSTNLDAAHLEFYFIGRKEASDPERYEECVRYCEEKGLKNVHFLGSRNDVPSILKSIDGFVYSTEHDTFGIAVIEAIAAELPVIVNDWLVMTEVCGGGNDGIRYFKTDDVDDAAAKIVALVKDIDASKKAAKENAKVVRSRFSIEQHIKNLESIYNTL